MLIQKFDTFRKGLNKEHYLYGLPEESSLNQNLIAGLEEVIFYFLFTIFVLLFEQGTFNPKYIGTPILISRGNIIGFNFLLVE